MCVCFILLSNLLVQFIIIVVIIIIQVNVGCVPKKVRELLGLGMRS